MPRDLGTVVVSAALIGLGSLGIIAGLADAAFGSHWSGLIWMIGGAIIFDQGTRLYSRKDTNE